jgi:hypothetical protein
MLFSMNKQFAVLALWLAGMLAAATACASDDPAADKQFLVAHNAADPRFLTWIERVGACRITTRPETNVIHFSELLYPRESVEKHEEGTVTVELILDADW